MEEKIISLVERDLASKKAIFSFFKKPRVVCMYFLPDRDERDAQGDAPSQEYFVES
jgi:hypothetical protein